MTTNAPHTSELGKKTHYLDQYDSSLLFPIVRDAKRQLLGINGDLPFVGEDLWTAYELSWLDKKGKPHIGVAQFYIPCTSQNLIESKSFKLYLNSFNQTPFVDAAAVKKVLAQDLSKAADAPVKVDLIEPQKFSDQKTAEQGGECLDDLDVAIDVYEPNPLFLQSEGAPINETLYSHLLKSNCPVTDQPDWASVQIHYVGPKINREGLLKYIVSFRQHNDFHEQCIERMFVDIMAQCKPEKLTVYARYTRRGGLDINPFRSNFEKIPASVPTFRQ